MGLDGSRQGAGGRKMKKRPTPIEENQALDTKDDCIPRHIWRAIWDPRTGPIIDALLFERYLSSKELDSIAGGSNGHQLVLELRLLGLEIPVSYSFSERDQAVFRLKRRGRE